MQTHTTTMDNWTGKNGEYQVYANGDVDLHGDRYSIGPEGRVTRNGMDFDARVWNMECREGHAPKWEAFSYPYGEGVSRQGATPQEALAKLLFNIV